MSQEFCEHCREAALKRENKFRGNQFVDALGNQNLTNDYKFYQVLIVNNSD